MLLDTSFRQLNNVYLACKKNILQNQIEEKKSVLPRVTQTYLLSLIYHTWQKIFFVCVTDRHIRLWQPSNEYI